MKQNFVLAQSPFLIHTLQTKSKERVYEYGIMFWHERLFQIHPNDILKELEQHSNTSDIPYCKYVNISQVCIASKDLFTKRPKNIPRNFILHLYSVLQIVKDIHTDVPRTRKQKR